MPRGDRSTADRRESRRIRIRPALLRARQQRRRTDTLVAVRLGLMAAGGDGPPEQARMAGRLLLTVASDFVPPLGLEPRTCGLKVRSSTN